ncbi:MAG TPA: flagellar biosynthesis protein FlhB [Firmicutes bacterium]|nr:flagellar biosynthesis protein FlhB [Bacillota bacterium]
MSYCVCLKPSVSKGEQFDDTLYRWNLQFFAGEEKTEDATPRKLQQARKKGQVARSNELSTVVTLLTGFMALKAGGSYVLQKLYSFFKYSFSSDRLHTVLDEVSLSQIINHTLLTIVSIFIPVGLAILVVGFLVNYLQTGGVFTLEPLKVKLDRINPLQGLKRMFSAQKLVDLFKAVFKIVGVGLIVWNTFKGQIFPLAEQGVLHPPIQLAALIWQLMFTIVLRIVMLLLALAVFDFYYQRYQYKKSLKMTKKEVQDEHKQTEGDPKVKSRIRQKQRQFSMRRMMQEVPKADVVITNPTHLAIAIKYEAKQMAAPQVLAKGEGYIAAKIKEIATEHQITLVENKPLARTIYQTVEIGEFIPPNLYQAVAEVLAFVYKLRQKR